jgi:hypothetical protein
MSDPANNFTTLFGIGGAFVIGVGALVLGLLLMVLWSLTAHAKPFFRGQTLTRDTPVLVPEDQHAVMLPHEAGERTIEE